MIYFHGQDFFKNLFRVRETTCHWFSLGHQHWFFAALWEASGLKQAEDAGKAVYTIHEVLVGRGHKWHAYVPTMDLWKRGYLHSAHGHRWTISVAGAFAGNCCQLKEVQWYCKACWCQSMWLVHQVFDHSFYILFFWTASKVLGQWFSIYFCLHWWSHAFQSDLRIYFFF